MISCRRTTELLSERLDQPLGLHKRVLLALHLVICRSCRAFAERLLSVRKECRADREFAGQELSLDARERIKALIERVDEPEQ